MRELLGPVKTVRTVSLFQLSPDSPAQIQGTSEETYDQDGALLQTHSIDSAGKPLGRCAFRHVGAAKVEEDCTTLAGPDPQRRITRFDTGGMTREIATYSLDGTLLGRVAFESTPAGLRKAEYDGTGRMVSEVVQHSTRTPQAGGYRQQTVANGKVIGEREFKETAEGTVSKFSGAAPDGHHEGLLIRDRSGTRSVQVRPEGSFAQAVDVTGRTITDIFSDHSGHEKRTVRHLDARHRVTAVEGFEGDVLHHKQITTYEDDEHGNWVGKVSRQYLANGEPQTIVTTTRTITYY